MVRTTPRALLYARLYLAIAAGCILLGCGGGGGGGGAGALVYQTDWTNRGSGSITGLSQRVEVFDSLGKLLKSQTVNQDSNGLQEVVIAGIGNGTRHLHIDLFSLRDLQGIQTGELDAWINISGNTAFLTGVGDTVSQVKLTPETATLEVQHSKQFYATGYSSPTKATFVELDAWTWETFGGIATVSQDGVVTGTAQGQGSVRATHNNTGLQGGATITVTPFQSTTSKWTVMVFMNAANDLSQFSMLNIDQMENVAGSPANVRFVVQWKQAPELGFDTKFDGTRRYLIKPNVANNQIDSELVQDMGESVDMGDPNALNDFLQWSKTYYPADRYVVVIWNHGNGWLAEEGSKISPTRGVSYDGQSGNFIRTEQLSQALGNDQWDVVAWDASLMQMIEVAFEIKDQAKFVIGSEESPPGEGYPYDLIFDDFRDSPNDTTRNLTKAFVDGMLQYYGGLRKITQSSIDTSQLDGLATALDTLAGELILNAGTIGPDIDWVRDNTQMYSENIGLNRHFRDIYHLCQNIESRLAMYPTIVNASANVRTALSSAVVWEGHNNNSPNSHGISIDFSKGSDFNNGNAQDYALLRFANATRWNEWLQIAP